MKITRKIKDKIEDSVFKKKIKPLKDALSKKIEEQVETYIQEQMKEYQSFIESAPDGWLYTSRSFCAVFGEGYEERFFVTLENFHPVPYSWYNGRVNVRLEISEKKWIKIFSDFRKEEINIKKYESELITELRGFLSGINTDKQLLENFPEISEFVNLNDFNFYAPVVQTEKLKKLLSEA